MNRVNIYNRQRNLATEKQQKQIKKHVEKDIMSFLFMGMQIKTTKIRPHIFIETITEKKIERENSTYWQECGEIRALVQLSIVNCPLVQLLWKTVCQCLTKLKVEL